MENFTLTRPIDMSEGDYVAEYDINPTFYNRIIGPTGTMTAANLESIRSRLAERPSPTENEMTFSASQSPSGMSQMWINNKLIITMIPNKLFIEHGPNNYNPERFRDRIDSILDVFIEAAESPVPSGGKKRKTRKSLRRRRRTIRK
jgi:hypothetical protein